MGGHTGCVSAVEPCAECSTHQCQLRRLGLRERVYLPRLACGRNGGWSDNADYLLCRTRLVGFQRDFHAAHGGGGGQRHTAPFVGSYRCHAAGMDWFGRHPRQPVDHHPRHRFPLHGRQPSAFVPLHGAGRGLLHQRKYFLLVRNRLLLDKLPQRQRAACNQQLVLCPAAAAVGHICIHAKCRGRLSPPVGDNGRQCGTVCRFSELGHRERGLGV